MNIFSPLLLVLASVANAQINLGTFNLNPNADGGIDLGFNQMANIFGFGGDRGIQFQTGRRGFNARTTGGAIVGNERIGVDSNVGVGEGQGLNLGSMLQLGNRPTVNPLGDLVNNVGRFFNSLVPQRVTPMPYSATGVIAPEVAAAMTPRPGSQRRTSSSWENNGDEEEIPLRITTEGRRGGNRNMQERNSAETGGTRSQKKTNKPPVLSGLVPMEQKESKKN
ncbi:hypothetical protein QR680_000072 [Steinernema hermaphroditum]|uniref:Uncharacterized protein n=1 Tax=Steinernema hermaphroditum TaxID=289476 RepID=A0AA39LDF1_9BILA|nr:hypothetical protein QR680_000072 [Steinernema hermaphroditum]